MASLSTAFRSCFLLKPRFHTRICHAHIHAPSHASSPGFLWSWTPPIQGCIAYEMAALAPPFDARNQIELARCIHDGKFSPLPPDYSQDLFHLVASSLHINPEARPSVSNLLSLVTRREGAPSAKPLAAPPSPIAVRAPPGKAEGIGGLELELASSERILVSAVAQDSPAARSEHATPIHGGDPNISDVSGIISHLPAVAHLPGLASCPPRCQDHALPPRTDDRVFLRLSPPPPHAPRCGQVAVGDELVRADGHEASTRAQARAESYAHAQSMMRVGTRVPKLQSFNPDPQTSLQGLHPNTAHRLRPLVIPNFKSLTPATRAGQWPHMARRPGPLVPPQRGGRRAHPGLTANAAKGDADDRDAISGVAAR